MSKSKSDREEEEAESVRISGKTIVEALPEFPFTDDEVEIASMKALGQAVALSKIHRCGVCVLMLHGDVDDNPGRDRLFREEDGDTLFVHQAVSERAAEGTMVTMIDTRFTQTLLVAHIANARIVAYCRGGVCASTIRGAGARSFIVDQTTDAVALLPDSNALKDLIEEPSELVFVQSALH